MCWAACAPVSDVKLTATTSNSPERFFQSDLWDFELWLASLLDFCSVPHNQAFGCRWQFLKKLLIGRFLSISTDAPQSIWNMSNAQFSISSSVESSLQRGDSGKSREFHYCTDSRSDNAGHEIYSTIVRVRLAWKLDLFITALFFGKASQNGFVLRNFSTWNTVGIRSWIFLFNFFSVSSAKLSLFCGKGVTLMEVVV